MSPDAPTVAASIGSPTSASRARRSRWMAASRMPTTSAWAARWDCISRWRVPSAIAAWPAKCRTRSNACCVAIWTSGRLTKICATFLRGIAMKNCASAWRESSGGGRARSFAGKGAACGRRLEESRVILSGAALQRSIDGSFVTGGLQPLRYVSGKGG